MLNIDSLYLSGETCVYGNINHLCPDKKSLVDHCSKCYRSFGMSITQRICSEYCLMAIWIVLAADLIDLNYLRIIFIAIFLSQSVQSKGLGMCYMNHVCLS